MGHRATRTVVLLVTAACLTVQLSAQAKPSFAGRWTTEPDPSAAAGQRAGGAAGGQRGGGRGDMGSGWGATFTITQDASRLTVEVPFFSRGDMQPPLRFVYALDGTETKNSMMMGRGIQRETSRTAWDGDKLVITTAHEIQSPDTGKPMTVEVRRTLSLDPDGSLVVETLRKGILGGQDVTTRTSYRKLS
jgi:hypothetical protein